MPQQQDAVVGGVSRGGVNANPRDDAMADCVLKENAEVAQKVFSTIEQK